MEIYNRLIGASLSEPLSSRFVYISERALATLYVGMGPVFSVLGGFDTPETHIRHVQNLILIAEMESAS